MDETKTAELIGKPITVEMASNDPKCFLHANRPATRFGNFPCSPKGELFMCEECSTSAGAKAFFEAYRESHSKNIKAFKQVNLNS